MTDGDHLAAVFADLTAENGTRHAPFRWQRRLLQRLLDADPPQAVDVPTGLGKTSVMALWLIALAEGAELPRRLVYVVDRRAVVDQATRFAEQLRRNIPDALGSKTHLAEGTRELPISTLRGGFADNRDWLEDPSMPAIIVGTIDMVGSRLLFEGYGVSRGMRPYHAGLLAVDTLVLLDEAHLCPPFEALLRRIAAERDGALGAVADDGYVTPPFHLMSLSATGRDVLDLPPEKVFRLNVEEREEPKANERLTARKRLQVTTLTSREYLTESMARRAIELAGGDSPSRVLVYCDSRKDAVAIKDSIDEECRRMHKAGELAAGNSSELLVGERRVHERRDLETWLDSRGFLGGATDGPDVPTFLVATSAGEVGVDLNADHMVCDLVACERLVQRLGRINRRGGANRQAMIDVFAVRPESKVNPKKAEKEKTERAIETFTRRLALLHALPLGEDGRYDASPAMWVDLKSNAADIVDAATTPAPLHPELTRPLLDAWSMTSLKRHEGRPEVAPWLRGWEQDEEPQTAVVWRRHLPYLQHGAQITTPSAMVAEFFRTAPIHATERLEAGSGWVFEWLLQRIVHVGERDTDHDLAVKGEEIVVVLIDRGGDHIASSTMRDLQRLAASAKSLSKDEQRQRGRRKEEWRDRHLPGATLVVDARIGGLRDGMLNEKAENAAAAADADEGWRSLPDPSESSRPLIGFRVEEVTGNEDEEGLTLPDDLDDWRHVRTFETRFDAGGTARRGLAVFKWHNDVTGDNSRSIVSVPQSLPGHVRQVVEQVRELTSRLGLPDDEAEAFTIAARLHDDGKAAERWQNAMNAPRDDRPYAKTRGGGNWRLLEGYRHEFGSLLKAERANLPGGARDLILHLIAAHHGNARPLVSSSGCDDGPPSLLESRAGDAALRFARLQRRYGPWGLAWREAILRAADQSASRESSGRKPSTQGGADKDG